jgi:ADP-ribosylglycohydrolase
VYRSGRLDDLVNGAREASISTHGGALAIAAAAATAAAVSAAIDAAPSAEIIARAERAAAEAENRWPGRDSLSFTRAVRDVHDNLRCLPVLRSADLAARYFPDRPMTIVPLALGLATVTHSAQEAILLAANIGGDSDSVASIAGGILGALYPSTVNQEWSTTVEAINEYDLTTIARELAQLRH